MGGSGVRNTKVGKDNSDRNDNIKVVVKVGQDDICKIQLFQSTVRALSNCQQARCDNYLEVL